MNRSLLFASLLGLVSIAASEEVLTWRITKGTTLARTFESSSSVDLQSVSIKLDGEEQSIPSIGDVNVAQDWTSEYSDEIQAVEGGRPSKLVRSFTKLSGHRAQTSKQPDHDEHEEKADLDSDLEGKSVLFVREGSEWTAKWAGDEKGDDALLEPLQAEVDFRDFLPGKEVSENDTWDVEAAAFHNFVRPGGRLSRKSKGEAGEVSNQREGKLDESLDGKGKAKYLGIRDEGGAKVAVIGITAELNAHASDDIDTGKGGTVQAKIELTYKLEGEILWDVANGFARTAKLEGALDLVQTHTGKVSTPDGEKDIEQVLSFAGKASYKLETERKP